MRSVETASGRFRTLPSGSNPSRKAKTPLVRGFAEREGLIRPFGPPPSGQSRNALCRNGLWPFSNPP
ncbi:MAG: hypothetical protein RI826_02580, partial [Chlorobium phaeovibrioides]|nr:hypothetical protein [Chlorobium phaeovibrioides]